MAKWSVQTDCEQTLITGSELNHILSHLYNLPHCILIQSEGAGMAIYMVCFFPLIIRQFILAAVSIEIFNVLKNIRDNGMHKLGQTPFL